MARCLNRLSTAAIFQRAKQRAPRKQPRRRLRKEGESSGTTSNTDGGDRDPSQLLPPASLNTLAPFEGDGYNWSLTSVARAKAMMGSNDNEEEYEAGLS